MLLSDLRISSVTGQNMANQEQEYRDETISNTCQQLAKVLGEPGGEVKATTPESHPRIHTGANPFPCKSCDKTYHRQASLKRHQLVHAKEKKACKLCDKTFGDSSTLARHQLVHTKEKRFRCEHCDKAFGRLDKLKAHRHRHTGEKPFRCEDCGKGFTRLDKLKVHRRTHAGGEKPVKREPPSKTPKASVATKASVAPQAAVPPKASVAPKASIAPQAAVAPKASLAPKASVAPKASIAPAPKRRQPSHTGEKKFSCNMCDKIFNEATNLKRHKFIHTGEKPFSCPQCDLSFRRSDQLRTHQRRHHPEVKPSPKSQKPRAHPAGLKTSHKSHKQPVQPAQKASRKSHGHGQNTSLKSQQQCALQPAGQKPSHPHCPEKTADKLFHSNTHHHHHLPCAVDKPFQCRLCDQGFNKFTTMLIHRYYKKCT